jgi:type IV pilus assembly protein PilQ
MNRLANITGAAALCLLLVCGCSQYKQAETTDPFMDKWKAKAQESKSYPAAPSQASQDLTKDPVATPAGLKPDPEKERPLPTKRISMAMSNVDVSVLLRALARAADVNIILNNKVTGRQHRISQAPWDGVLGIHAPGLSYSGRATSYAS